MPHWQMFLLVYMLGVNLINADRDRAAFFLDESGSQTYTIHADRAVVDALEDQILDMLDMEDAPKTNIRRKRDERVTVFMSNLYRQMEVAEQRSMCNDESCKLRKWISADRIMSISDPEQSQTTPGRFKLTFPCESWMKRNAGKLFIAQFQLALPLSTEPRNVSLSFKGISNSFMAQIVPPLVKEISFNITEPAALWINENMACTVTVGVSESADVDYLDIVGSNSFIIAGFKDGARQSKQRRVKRSSPALAPQPQRQPELKLSGTLDSLNEEESATDGCRRQGLYVDFSQLGWKEWLIAPEGYSAFFCGGACSFPLHSRMNATNHAIVQTLAHLVHSNRAEQAKCAAIQLSSMKILFIDNHQNVVMKRYRDMIVQECGCQ